jgi:hypothetical protein
MRSILAGASRRRVIAWLRTNARQRGGRLAQDNEGRTGIDHKVDKPTFDPRLDLEMALTVGLKHQAATGRGRFTQIVGRFEDLRLGTRFNYTIGKPGCIAPGDDQPDGKENQLTHDKA